MSVSSPVPPQYLSTSVLVPSVSHSRFPASLGGLPRPAGRSGPGSNEVTVFPWVPVHTRPCMCPSGVEFLSPLVSCGTCDQALLVFKAKCSGAPPFGAGLSGCGA